MATQEWTERQRYVFKRTIEELGSYRGQGTELVTLYVPPTRQLSDVNGMLREEIGQASNIKSKGTGQAVQGALTSILARLKTYKQTPPHGLAVFVGNVVVGSNKTRQVAHVIEPPLPVGTYQYRCDSSFNVEPLEEMLEHEETYGLLVIDRKECSIGLLKGKSVQVVHNKQSLVPSKHGRGGQSQRRFERLTEQAAHEWFKECGERASEVFLHEDGLKAVIIGGPGPTKEFFVSEGYLHHEVQKKVHPQTFDTGYTDDEQGLKELVEAAGNAIRGIGMQEEKELVRRFLRETAKPTGGRGEYGEEPVRKALDMGAVEHLLLSEDLRRKRLRFRHHKTQETLEKTVEDAHVDRAFDEVAKKWGGANNVDVEENDLIEDLSDLAESSGTKVHIVGPASEEGQILRNAFGGVVALLRYRYQ